MTVRNDERSEMTDHRQNPVGWTLSKRSDGLLRQSVRSLSSSADETTGSARIHLPLLRGCIQLTIPKGRRAKLGRVHFSNSGSQKKATDSIRNIQRVSIRPSIWYPKKCGARRFRICKAGKGLSWRKSRRREEAALVHMKLEDLQMLLKIWSKSHLKRVWKVYVICLRTVFRDYIKTVMEKSIL